MKLLIVIGNYRISCSLTNHRGQVFPLPLHTKTNQKSIRSWFSVFTENGIKNGIDLALIGFHLDAIVFVASGFPLSRVISSKVSLSSKADEEIKKLIDGVPMNRIGISFALLVSNALKRVTHDFITEITIVNANANEYIQESFVQELDLLAGTSVRPSFPLLCSNDLPILKLISPDVDEVERIKKVSKSLPQSLSENFPVFKNSLGQISPKEKDILLIPGEHGVSERIYTKRNDKLFWESPTDENGNDCGKTICKNGFEAAMCLYGNSSENTEPIADALLQEEYLYSLHVEQKGELKKASMFWASLLKRKKRIHQKSNNKFLSLISEKISKPSNISKELDALIKNSKNKKRIWVFVETYSSQIFFQKLKSSKSDVFSITHCDLHNLQKAQDHGS